MKAIPMTNVFTVCDDCKQIHHADDLHFKPVVDEDGREHRRKLCVPCIEARAGAPKLNDHGGTMNEPWRENEILRAEVQRFRAAKDRPWFCRECKIGALKPWGKTGYACRCGARYEPVYGYDKTEGGAHG